MNLSIIKKYIMPKEVDFLSALNQHAMVITKITDDLHKCFIEASQESCEAILQDIHKSQEMREKNMNELLSSFITPLDRESIYRVITQLDWIAVSITHFVVEAKAYDIHLLDANYAVLIEKLQLQSKLLTAGFKTVKADAEKTAENAQRVRDTYNELVALYAQTMAQLVKENNLKEVLIHKELLSQLKEIGKRMQMCANSLEDIIMKMN
ncbi:hypothetical protein [Sulfurimonas sp. C5]|uniref:DUF47 domain-containing protein n=1 Tax=Sulfurimonas sp. C5 TaxID=3036947 RepID=UPI002453D980|nr:hypothetical protein [Sulfurimonas sp. C5]MDH4944099.1 hypothetical protein [Sulfurimonas sp. C5]